MLHDHYRKYYWKACKDELFGFPAGSLVVVDYHAGGGFAGAPEVLTLAPKTSIAPLGQPEPEVVEFVKPGPDLEYRIGGHQFSGYNYFNQHVAEGSVKNWSESCDGSSSSRTRYWRTRRSRSSN